jgi:CTP synthase
MKVVFITGGVMSSLGKGVTSASLGMLLKIRGYKVTMMKFDPYLNVDPGTMNPYQHGEVFVTYNGGETDLDLGHYERFIDQNLSSRNSISAGKVYLDLIERERRGDFNGGTVQVVPHVTGTIKEYIRRVGQGDGADIVLVEVGGTVGDIEGLPFIEAISQYRMEAGLHNTAAVHLTYIPYIAAVGELKTKPTQHSVRNLCSMGIVPDVLVCRCSQPLTSEIRNKISYLCSITQGGVIENCDVDTIYQVPLLLESEGLCTQVLKALDLPDRPHDLSDWRAMVQRIVSPKREVTVALVGKYVKLHDAYLSVSEALCHAGAYHDTRVNIQWVESDELHDDNVCETLRGCDAVLVPGGFGQRGTEGMIASITYARTQKKPFFGLCLGLQMAVIEYARNVEGMAGANSTEMDPKTPHPVIDLMETQIDVTDLGGTQRLGLYDCKLTPQTFSCAAYGQELIQERHRHRYEFNAAYADQFFSGQMRKAGVNPETGLVEIVELRDHPWFVGVQFHPEFLSRPMRPHPLFRDFIAAALAHKNESEA